MAMAWPTDFPGLGTGAARLAQRIEAMSGGRIRIRVFGAGELVPAYEVFDAVSRGTVDIGHSAAYYWRSKLPEAQWFGAVPFGMSVHEVNAWLYHGGGLELWQETYQPHNIVPFPAGNTGVQMGGFFKNEINSLEDFRGLRMRIPGLGGEVFRRIGGSPANLPGGELFTALQTGAIDAVEWVGPYNDLAFGLHRAARFYYYPGWQEPAASLEALINAEAWASLPDDLKAIVRAATEVTNQDMLCEYMARNPAALKRLIEEHNIQVRPFPEPVLEALHQAADEVVAELAANSELSGRIHRSYREFQQLLAPYMEISEDAYAKVRKSLSA
jgi:TRAP-type mannitol/chloroaromatic compound transport system substrate-binding protein